MKIYDRKTRSYHARMLYQDAQAEISPKTNTNNYAIFTSDVVGLLVSIRKELSANSFRDTVKFV